MTQHIDTRDIEQTVIRNISEALLVPPEKITLSSRLITDLNAESIDIADIRFRLEHDLRIRIDQRSIMESVGGVDAAKMTEQFTVGALIEFVRQRIAEGSPAK